MDLLKQLAKLLPTDPSDRAGYGPFRLPQDAEWMESVFRYHDYYYEIGPEAGMKLSDIDWRIFKALSIAAEIPDDTIERCHRAHQICDYWPIMRSIGHLLYGRHREGTET
jgi:hypothetical protein